MQNRNRSDNHLLYLLIAAILGLIVGAIYLGFEWLVNHGSNWLWNELVQSDEYRWRVIPLALIMSLILSIAYKLLSTERVVKPSMNLLDELDDIHKTTILMIIKILFIGALSLIAGASLGPEASLVAASMGIAAWFSGKINSTHKPIAFVFSISSLGALLAAFFNSLLPIIIPILIFKKKDKLSASNALIAILAGIAAWLVVHIIKNEAYIEIPVKGTFSVNNFLLASVLGLIAVILALIVKWAIHITYPAVAKFNKSSPWIISAVIFGTVLGLLYLVGGQTVQFSGSEGLKLLSQDPAQYGLASLIGLVVVKLLATSWSLTSGYRGGLVFPSIYMGAVLSLAFSTIFSLTGATEAGTTIGAITGVLMGMTNPIIGIVLALALFPVSQFSIVFGAVIGSFIGLKLTNKLLPQENK